MKTLASTVVLLWLLQSLTLTNAAPLQTERVSVNPVNGAQADSGSTSPVLSADGCIVAFVSQATTLAPASYGLNNNSPAQVYAVNRCVTPHQLELVSVTDDGTSAANDISYSPNISDDGRYVAFISQAGNLPVPNSLHNAKNYVFVRDRMAQKTLSPLEALRTTGSNVIASPSPRYMSGDGTRFVLRINGDTSLPSNLYVFDTAGGVTTMHSVCPSDATLALACTQAKISGDGTTTVFDTSYPLIASDANGFIDLYSQDVASSSSNLVSVNANGTQANGNLDNQNGVFDLSADGNQVAFLSGNATDFPGDTFNSLLVKTRSTGDLALALLASDGTPAQLDPSFAGPRMSADGNRLVFNANDSLPLAAEAPDGFNSSFVLDRSLGRTVDLCISSRGAYAAADCDSIAISADGHWAALRSDSQTLVPNDTNGQGDIFVIAIDPAIDHIFADGFEP